MEESLATGDYAALAFSGAVSYTHLDVYKRQNEVSDEVETPDLLDLDGTPPETGTLARGVAAIRAVLKTMPPNPGVYRMLDRKGDALYIGKASNLKNRVASYTHVARLPHRLQRMVAETHSLEIVITHTEVEALLLECNLIKRMLPRYNVLLRDDKSFPYIPVSYTHLDVYKRQGFTARTPSAASSTSPPSRVPDRRSSTR